MATEPVPVVRRRVAFVTPQHFGDESYVGGGERYPLNLARGLIAADPHLHVEIIATGSPRHVTIQPRLDLRVLAVTDPGPNTLNDVSGGIVDALIPVDLVHVHQGFVRPSQVAILVAKFLGKPLVLSDHGAGVSDVEQAVRFLDLVDRLVFYSRFGASMISGGRSRITIPGGVDDRFFRPPDTPAVREFILYVGRLLPHKGIDRLISAIPPDLPLVLAGRAYDAAYATYLRTLAVGRDVTFVEDADDLAVRDLYRRAWVTVLPSVHLDAWGRVYEAPELMGFTVLESMACGTPAIVSAAAALPEFVRDGETGFVCAELSELAARARGLAEGEFDCEALGARAREIVQAEYSLEVAGQKLRATYEDLWIGDRLCAS